MWYRKIVLCSREDILRANNVPEDIIQHIISNPNTEQANLDTQKALAYYKKHNTHIPLEEFYDNSPKQNIWTPSELRWTAGFENTPVFQKWALVQMRKQRIKQFANGEWEYRIHPSALHAMLEQIRDWWSQSRPTPQISSFTLEQAKKLSDEWHRMMIGEGAGKMYEPINPANIVYGPIWSNPEWEGYTIQAVTSENDLKCEGGQMNHCVGGYYNDVANGNSRIYSLRSPENKPLATIELEGSDNNIVQVKGVNNRRLKGDNYEMVYEWLHTLDNVTHNDNKYYQNRQFDYNYHFRNGNEEFSYLPQNIENAMSPSTWEDEYYDEYEEDDTYGFSPKIEDNFEQEFNANDLWKAVIDEVGKYEQEAYKYNNNEQLQKMHPYAYQVYQQYNDIANVIPQLKETAVVMINQAMRHDIIGLDKYKERNRKNGFNEWWRFSSSIYDLYSNAVEEYDELKSEIEEDILSYMQENSDNTFIPQRSEFQNDEYYELYMQKYDDYMKNSVSKHIKEEIFNADDWKLLLNIEILKLISQNGVEDIPNNQDWLNKIKEVFGEDYSFQELALENPASVGHSSQSPSPEQLALNLAKNKYSWLKMAMSG